MKTIKTSWDLQVQDLPLIESPSIAAALAGELFHSSHVGVHNFRREFVPQTADQLGRALRAGRLLLVFSSVGFDKPFSPVVTWTADSDHPNGGSWRLNDNTFGLGLESQVDAINKWTLTPQTIQQVGGGRVGGLEANQLNSIMIERRAEERFLAKQQAAAKHSLPLGAAAAVAPIASAGAAKELNTETPKKKETQKKPVHLEVGIFTDGTLNNAGNIEIYRQRVKEECLEPRERGDIDDAECERRLALVMGESYANGPSNIAKLRDLYPESKHETESSIKIRRRVYEPGAGSKTGSSDSLQGMATGLGETGVIAQVQRVFAALALLVETLQDQDVIDQLTVDLFGFSRGGAAARHAANEIAIGVDGELGKAFGDRGLSWPERVTIRFIGLFDTVAGIVNLSEGDWSAANDMNAPVKLYLAPNISESVVQFAALDECRANFALNSLCSSDGSLPPNFREIQVPGAHSDIGGGYHDSQTEELLLSPTLTIEGSDTGWPEQTVQWDNLVELKAETENEGWIGSLSPRLQSGEMPSLKIEKTVHAHPVPDGRIDLDLILKREVLGGLSQVYLHCMHKLARRVPLNDVRTNKIATAVPDELKLALQIFSEQIISGINRPKLPPIQTERLKQRYTHHSDHYNWAETLVESLFGEVVIKGEVPLKPMRPAPGRKRIVHQNRAAQKPVVYTNRPEA